MRLQIILLVLSIITDIAFAEFWQKPNGPRGAHVMDIVRSEEGTLFLGTFTTGVFRSRDKGNSWESINNGLPQYEITFLTIDFQEHLYAAVGNKGVYISTNYGDSWKSLGSKIENEKIQTIFVDEDGTIYVAPRGWGIFKSTDGGQNWESMGLKYKTIQTIVKLSNGRFLAGGNDGIYRFNETTGLWDYISGEIPKEPVHTIVFDETNNTVYAGTYGLGVLRSRDNGDSWTYVNNGFADVSYGWIEELVVHKDRIYASASHWYFGGLYYSTDEGESWIELETDISHKEFQSMLVSDVDIFLGVVNYGLYHSKVPFDKWEPRNNGFWFYQTNCLTSDSKGYIYAGTSGAGFFRSQDNGRTWKERNRGTNVQDVRTVDCTSKDRIYMGVFFEGVYFSDTAGDLWTLHRTNLHNLNLNCLAHNDEYLFVGTSIGLYRSTLSNDPWEKISSSLATAQITSLYVSNQKIYAGTSNGKIMMSFDNGDSWTNISNELPTQSISAIMENVQNQVFVVARTAGIYKSIDNGVTWTDLSYDLPTRVINDLVYVNNEVYAGTEKGIFQLDGNHWIPINDGLWNTSIHDIHVDQNGFMWVATDIGVSRSIKRATAVEKSVELPQCTSIRLLPSIPNPFNGSTRILFELSEKQHVVLEIYNIRGQLISSLFDGDLKAGRHRIIWNAADHASGIYLVRLTADQYCLIEKIILQK